MRGKYSEIINAAWQAQRRAYAPYSHFAVGAALQTKEGKIFCGVNVENSAYGLSICAERSALFSAVSSGYREFSFLAVVSDSARPIRPCGACRQVLAEFDAELPIILVGSNGEVEITSLMELFPQPFSLTR
ncbi:MAG: cytidine deaminase [Dethiobacteria bacterium]|jgi:cytidine deaminase|nr:cytidine deaminase [Bacillota bacterium]